MAKRRRALRGPSAHSRPEKHAVRTQILQGLKQIGEYLGLQQMIDARRLVLSWISREGLPAKRIGGRWCADVEELEAWWVSRRDVAAGSPSKSRG
jgi:hypothetical protein